MLEKIHIIIAIFAALVISIISFFSDNDLYTHSLWLIATIVIFYFIGLIVRAYLTKYVFLDNDKDELIDQPPPESEDGPDGEAE